jgi:hypothetical protein
VIAAGIIAVALLLVVTGFQVALALGAPLGAGAWGGRHRGVLPARLRIASAATGLVIYPLVMAIVLDASGLIDVEWLPRGPIVMWALAALFALGSLANFASRSPVERLWGPVALAIAICCTVIAVTS